MCVLSGLCRAGSRQGGFSPVSAGPQYLLYYSQLSLSPFPSVRRGSQKKTNYVAGDKSEGGLSWLEYRRFMGKKKKKKHVRVISVNLDIHESAKNLPMDECQRSPIHTPQKTQRNSRRGQGRLEPTSTHTLASPTHNPTMLFYQKAPGKSCHEVM